MNNDANKNDIMTTTTTTTSATSATATTSEEKKQEPTASLSVSNDDGVRGASSPLLVDDDNDDDPRKNEVDDDVSSSAVSWLRKLVVGVSETKANNNSIKQQRPLFVLAPMVDQSDLPFRLLTRRYGCDIAFTPMIHAKMFCQSPKYRSKFSLLVSSSELSSDDEEQNNFDRPLIVQLCGSSVQHCLQTALALQSHCDMIDINCGCPQSIAKRGNYGAFLLEKPNELIEVVRTLVQNLSIPVSCKVRLLPQLDDPTRIDIDRSLTLYKQLVNAGISLLTIHGRTRYEKCQMTKMAHWDMMRIVVNEIQYKLNVPVIVNGSVCSLQQAMECWSYTNYPVGIMSSEAVLEYPALFQQQPDNNADEQQPERVIGRVQLAYEYLDLAQQYPPDIHGQGNGIKCIRMHLHRMLHADLQSNPIIRQALTNAKTVPELRNVVDSIQTLHTSIGHKIQNEQLSWYMRHRSNNNISDGDGTATTTAKNQNGDDDDRNNDNNYAEDEDFCAGGAGLFDGGEDDDDY